MAFILSGHVWKVGRVAQVSAALSGAAKLLPRELSTLNKINTKTVTRNEDEILKSVFISQSNDIFTNLAIEDWLYKNSVFSNHHILLIWRNAPCVVVGRHQNPWLESNMRFLSETGVDIARRNSGGIIYSPFIRYSKYCAFKKYKLIVFRRHCIS